MLRSTGTASQLHLTGTLSDNSTIDLTSSLFGTTYATSASSVATVSPDGLVTAVGSGQTLVTALNSGLSASTTVQVDLSPLQSLAISPSSGPISINSISPIFNQQLTVTGTYSDSTYDDLTSSATGTAYQTSDSAIASVGASGLVSFTQPGDVTITASRCQMADGSCQTPLTSTATFTVSEFNPIPLGQVSIPGANNVKADSRCQMADGSCGFVYVTTGGGLSVVAVNSPTNPQVVGSVALNGNAVDLAIGLQMADGSRQVYVANGSNVAIVDVSSPSAPTLAGTFTTGGSVQAVALSGCHLPSDICYLYVGDDQGLKVYSLSNPTAPSLLGSVALGGTIKGMAEGRWQTADGRWQIYVSRGNQMSVVDVSTPSAPVLQGSVSFDSRGIAANGNFAYVASGTNGVQVVDATHPSAPVLVGATNIRMDAQGVVARCQMADSRCQNPLVLTAEDIFVNSLPIFNLSNPKNPAYVGVINFPGSLDGLRVDANNFLVFVVGSGMLEIGQYAPEVPAVPPAVQLLQPAAGATVIDGGLVPMTASASHPIGVGRVDFLVNGVARISVGTSQRAADGTFQADVRLPAGFVGQNLILGARAYSLSGIPSAVVAVAVNVVPDPLTMVQGRLLNVLSDPLPGVGVNLFNGKLTGVTDANGDFSVPGVPTVLGPVVLSASATVQGIPVSVLAQANPVPSGTTSFGDVILTANSTLSGSVSGTLDALHSPYQVTSDITVPVGQTLTLEPGTVLKMALNANFTVNGTLVANGDAAHPVAITSLEDDAILGDTGRDGPTTGAPGQWNTLQFNGSTAATQLSSVLIRFGRQTVLAGASPQLNDVIISSMSARAIAADIASSPSGANNQASGCALNGIDRSGGSIPSTVVWPDLGFPYVVQQGRVFVEAGGRLSLPAGVVVKGQGDDALVIRNGGELITQGTASSPVIFTSIHDDTVGGDTENDGSSSSPQPSDWAGVQFVRAGPGSQLTNTVFRYGGVTGTRIDDLAGDETIARLPMVDVIGSTLTLVNCQISSGAIEGMRLDLGAAVTVSGSAFNGNNQQGGTGTGARVVGASSLTVVSSQFSGNLGYGINAGSDDGGFVSVSGSTFTANAAAAVQIHPALAFQSVALSASGNGTNGIDVIPGSIARVMAWDTLSLPYVIQSGRVFVEPGGRLTMPAGVVVKGQGDDALVIRGGGELITQGTAASPVIFTSIHDDTVGGDTESNGSSSAPQPGDWAGVQFVQAGPGSQLTNTVFRYGGVTGTRIDDLAGDETFTRLPLVDVLGSTLSITHCQMSQGASDGLRLDFGAQVVVASSTLSGNFNGLYNISSSNSAVSQSIIQGNSSYGVRNDDASMNFDARNNYWGSATGPTHPSNPGGTGDAVTDHVDYVPFLNNPPF